MFKILRSVVAAFAASMQAGAKAERVNWDN